MRFPSFFVLGALSASGAWAGGYLPPVTEPVVAAPVVMASVAAAEPASDWAGGYAGGSLGYAFGADDQIGLDVFEDGALTGKNADLGAVDVKGVTAGLHAGYRWQRGNWVFGPELWIEGGSVDAADSVVLDKAGAVESSVNYLLGLQVKTGYAASPRTLVYGTAGAVHGDFDYTLAGPDGSETVGYTANGYSLGLGVERKLRDNLSVFAEWQYRTFGRTDVDFGDDETFARTEATPEHHHVKLGVNFRF